MNYVTSVTYLSSENGKVSIEGNEPKRVILIRKLNCFTSGRSFTVIVRMTFHNFSKKVIHFGDANMSMQ